jgi:hypothetical protein
MFAEFQHEYAQLSDDEVLRLAADCQSLIEEARSAMDAEMRNRNLTLADLAKHECFVKRNAQRETIRRNQMLFGTRRTPLEWGRFAIWALLVVSVVALVAMWLAAR